MVVVIKKIFEFGPLLFGFGFMAPLIAQSLERSAVTLPTGLTPLMVGLAVGGALGLIAQLRGRWI